MGDPDLGANSVKLFLRDPIGYENRFYTTPAPTGGYPEGSRGQVQLEQVIPVRLAVPNP
jgi:hypothetical protein